MRSRMRRKTREMATLEPAVLEKISAHKKAIARLKASITVTWLIPSLIEIAVIVMLLRWFFVQHSEKARNGTVFLLAVGIPIFLLMIGVFVAYVFRSLKQDRERFSALFETAPVPDHLAGAFEKFEGALATVSIAAGIDSPRLVPIVHRGLSTAAFTDAAGDDCVAVSLQCLSANLSVGEVEGLMASETGKVLLEELTPWPRVRNLQSVMWVLPQLLALLFLVIGSTMMFLTTLGGDPVVLIVFVYTAVVLMTLAFVFLNGRLKRLRSETDLLADSVAMKLTGDPEALVSALRKLSSLMMLGELFTGFKSIDTAGPELSEGKMGLLGPKKVGLFEDGRIARQSLVVLKQDDEHVARRIANLKEIEVGHWAMFRSVVAAKVSTGTDAWE